MVRLVERVDAPTRDAIPELELAALAPRRVLPPVAVVSHHSDRCGVVLERVLCGVALRRVDVVHAQDRVVRAGEQEGPRGMDRKRPDVVRLLDCAGGANRVWLVEIVE